MKKFEEALFVANMPGSSKFKPEDYGVSSWKEYYEQHTGEKFNDDGLHYCYASKKYVKCTDIVGAHVVSINNPDGQIYIAMIEASKNDEKSNLSPFKIPVCKLVPFDPDDKVKK